MRTVPGNSQRHPTMRRGAAGALSLAAVGVLAACVPAGNGNYFPTAGRAATPAEALAVTAAVHSSPLTAGAGTRPYRLEAIRVSTRTPGYAFATLDPTIPAADGAAVALRHPHHRRTPVLAGVRHRQSARRLLGSCPGPQRVRTALLSRRKAAAW